MPTSPKQELLNFQRRYLKDQALIEKKLRAMEKTADTQKKDIQGLHFANARAFKKLSEVNDKLNKLKKKEQKKVKKKGFFSKLWK